MGEPADDVAALGVNYLFYGLRRRAATGDEDAGPFSLLMCIFLETYLREAHDQEMLQVIPPFLAFRALVLAHPRWYPTLTEPTRRALIHFARRMMADSLFDPTDVRALLGCAR